MRAKVGQLDINFKEITTTAQVWIIFMTVAVWSLSKITSDIQATNQKNLSDCLSEDILSQTSRNLPVSLSSELRNWDYNLFQPLIIVFLLFP